MGRLDTTRREVLLLASYAASRVAAAQESPNELVVTNSQGISVFPYGDRSTPAVATLTMHDPSGIKGSR